MGQRTAIGFFGLYGIDRQTHRTPEVGNGVQVLCIEGGQLTQQLLIQVLAVGQAGEVQRLNRRCFDQPRQGVMGGHGHVHGNAAGHEFFQLLGGAVGVIVDADAAFLLETLQHLGGDVVVPVVDADHLFGAGQ